MTVRGRSSGHPVTAQAARAGSPAKMENFLKIGAMPGDLWILGPHRLVCGDATDAATVARCLGDHRPNLMVTDPPYGVGYDASWRAKLGKAGRAISPVLNDDRCDWREAWALFPGDIAYVWHGALDGLTVADGLSAAGFLLRSQIVWDKGRLIISRGHYHWRHETCWYAVRKGRTAHWMGDRRQTTVWPVPHRRSQSGHSTEKPVEVMRRPILNHTAPGEAVYDPFVGSGTTIQAAEETGRICLAVELSPAHCDMAIRRWAAFTTIAPQLVRG